MTRDLTRFLGALFLHDDLIEIRPIECWVEAGKKKSRLVGRHRAWLRSGEIVARADRLAAITQAPEFANIFFGVCPRPESGVGTKEDIQVVRVLWADLDSCTPAEALQRVREAGLPAPTVVVASGHGAHLYWVLSTPVLISSSEDRMRIETVVSSINSVIGGDHVHDLSRILRLPGFVNVKDGRNGAEPASCDLYDANNREYELDEIESCLPAPTQAPRRNGQAKAAIPDPIRVWVTQKLEADTDDRSKRDFAIVCRLIRARVAPDDAWQLVSGHSKFGQRDRQYFDLTWRKAEEAVRAGVRNFDLVDVEDEAGKIRSVRVPIHMTAIVKAVAQLTGRWPRACGNTLFVVSDGEAGIDWIGKPPDLFGYLHSIAGKEGVCWANGVGYVTKGEFFAELARLAERYDSVEVFPHVPPRANTFYVPRRTVVAPRDGLTELVGRFCPKTEQDRELIRAALITPMWGGSPGSRPGFVIDSNDGDCGRGVGKTRLAMMIGALYGGHFLIGEAEDREKLLKRLLTPSARTKRVCIIDNAKARLSSADIESLVTAKTLSGYANYIGEAERPNTLTWIITANGVELSKDLAQRVIVIRLARPAYDPEWEEQTLDLIERRQDAIFAGIREILTARLPKLRRFSRWAAWEAQVLAAMDGPDALQKLIAERQVATDVDKELFETLVDYFRHKIRAAGYVLMESLYLRIPSGIAAEWYREATGEAVKPMTAARHLKRACAGQWEIQPDPSRHYGRCFLFSMSKEAMDEVPLHFDPEQGQVR